LRVEYIVAFGAKIGGVSRSEDTKIFQSRAEKRLQLTKPVQRLAAAYVQQQKELQREQSIRQYIEQWRMTSLANLIAV
jgi:hypothetical protein